MLTKHFRSCIFALLLGGWIKECITCFTDDESEVAKVKSGSSFYQECRCEEPGPSGMVLKWFDVNDQEVQELGYKIKHIFGMAGSKCVWTVHI
ncbi:unnamed protein product, partial [Iphiclides podalirius]